MIKKLKDISNWCYRTVTTWRRAATSMVVCLAIVTTMTMQVFAESEIVKPNYDTQNVEVVDHSDNKKEPLIVKEVLSKRTENEKTFQLDDGSFIAVVYEEPVHYLNSDGIFKEFDNELIEVEKDEPILPNNKIQKKEFVPKNSNKEIEISQKASEEDMLSIESEGFEVTWGYIGANQTDVEKIENKHKDLKGNDKFLVIENFSQEVCYKNIFANVDLQAFVTTSGLKENLILKNAKSQRQFDIQYKIGDLNAKQVNDRTIELYDDNDTLQYVINAPVMIDDKGAFSEAIKLEIISNENGSLIIRLTVDSAWLDESERDYPITVDPTIKIGSASGISSSYQLYGSSTASTYNANYVSTNSTYLYVGTCNTDNEYQSVRAVTKLNTLPTLGIGDVITSAKLNLSANAKNGAGDMQINAHQITDISNNSWNGVSYNSQILDYYIQSSIETATFDITSVAKQWYDGTTTNYGILLDSNAEGLTSNRYIRYYGSASSSGSLRPVFELSYRNYKGVEDGLTYHSFPVGYNGTASIGDYLGNLVIRQNICVGTGNRMPVTISLTYNSLLYDTVFGNGSPGGYGWQFSFNQYVKLASMALQSEGYKYIYTDEDGTEHYYKLKDGSSTEWIDEDNNELVITEGSGYIFLRNGIVEKKFKIPANGGQLVLETDISNTNTNISDLNRAKITYNYNSLNNLTSIVDGAGRTYTLTYCTNSNTNQVRVDSITDPAGQKTTFAYWGGTTVSNFDRLSNIYYPDGSNTPLGYYTNHRIGSFYTPDSSYLGFSFNSLGKVSQVKEYDTTGAVGNYLNISYSTNSTTYTDKQSRSEQYHFYSDGKTSQITNSDGSIINAYPSTKTKTSFSVSEKYVKNYLLNSNIETSSGYTISTTSGSPYNSYCSATDLIDEEPQQYLGAKSRYVYNTSSAFTSQVYQDVSISDAVNKTYTYSAYVKTKGVLKPTSDSGVYLKLYYLDSSSNVISSTNGIETLSGDNKWSRLSVTGTAPSGTTKIRASVYMNNIKGKVWFDCVQLEESPVANSYNALQYADEPVTTGSYWNGTNSLFGNVNSTTNVSQTVGINKKGVNFNIYGEVTAVSAVPISNETRKFGIQVDLAYADGTTVTNEGYGEFDPTITTAQKIAFVVQPSKPNVVVTSLTYKYIYDYEIGTMTIENSMLNIGGEVYTLNTESEPVTYPSHGSYANFDSYGNATSFIEGTLTSESSYDSSKPFMQTSLWYDSTKNYVTMETDEFGKNTSYSVNANNGLINSVSDKNGNTTSYTYNQANGNLTGVSSIQAVNNYTYDEASRLLSVNHNGFSYNFTYDTFGKPMQTKVGAQILSTNTYVANNGNLTQTEYGNGDKYKYFYDNYDRIVNVLDKNNANMVQYSYNYKGQIARTVDSCSGIATDYYYSADGTIEKELFFGNKTGKVVYGENSTSYNNIGGHPITVGKDADGDYTSGTVTIDQDIDDFGRILTSRAWEKENVNSYVGNIIDYSYFNGNAPNKTSYRIEEITNNYNGGSLEYTYTYDNNGNILTVKENGILKESYSYNIYNRLVSNTSAVQGKKYSYTYDIAGNITNIRVTNTSSGAYTDYNYTYGDSEWKDKLTNYNGTNITYDAIGNPLNYRDGMAFTWKNCRQLATFTKSGVTTNYTYNYNNLRTQKSVGGILTNYNYSDDGTLLSLTQGSKTLWFMYGEGGSPIGFEYWTGSYFEPYYYTKNVQGDITGFTTCNGNLVASYQYDAYGKLVGKSGSTTLAKTLVDVNPLRYRGYVYDEESGLYYLQSRYYDPTTCRFVNMDDVSSIVLSIENIEAQNLFEYCNNNPIFYVDPYGYWVEGLAGFKRSGDHIEFKTIASFTSKPYCLAVAADIIRKYGKWSWKKMTVVFAGYTTTELAAEIYLHGCMYYSSSLTIKVFGRGYSWKSSAKKVDIDPNDPRAGQFMLFWVLA